MASTPASGTVHYHRGQIHAVTAVYAGLPGGDRAFRASPQASIRVLADGELVLESRSLRRLRQVFMWAER